MPSQLGYMHVQRTRYIFVAWVEEEKEEEDEAWENLGCLGSEEKKNL